MRYTLLLVIFLNIFSCKDAKSSDPTTVSEASETEIDNTEVAEPSGLEAISTKDFREFKVLDSKHLTKAEIWRDINPEMEDFTETDYNRLKPLILEQAITTLQKHISEGKFNYQELTKFYLFRIRQFDRENTLSLNSVIAINPNAIKRAKALDLNVKNAKHPIYGMPILLKDNINTKDMATTAGAVALKDNVTEDAFIVKQLTSKGALILGKANLSEWAYFF